MTLLSKVLEEIGPHRIEGTRLKRVLATFTPARLVAPPPYLVRFQDEDGLAALPVPDEDVALDARPGRPLVDQLWLGPDPGGPRARPMSAACKRR